MAHGRVSVVVPTRNRPSLVVAAVASALDQTYPPHEVVVVVDGPDDKSVAALEDLQDRRVRVHVHERSRGAGAARNTGVRLAEGVLVAFLDDDDRWLPAKLERQVTHWEAAEAGDRLLVSCQSRFVTGRDTAVWPTRPPRRGERIADYLFVRNQAGEGALPTPTFLLPKAVAAAHPMSEHLTTHEEWDWLLDLEQSGIRVEVVMEPLAIIDAAPKRRSVSGDSPWRATLAWACSGLSNVSFIDPVSSEQYPDLLRAADVLLVNERSSVGDMALPSTSSRLTLPRGVR